MEGRKEAGSCSFSFNELFGPKDPPAPKGYFESILGPPPPKMPGKVSLHAEEKGQDSAKDAGNKKSGDGNSKSSQTEGVNKKTQDFCSIFEKQHGYPCNLSSSVYYGGPDIIAHPSNYQASGSNSVYKAGGQDDSGATRGNWWQESLFY